MAATGLEAAQRAYASPALMREALDAELLEAAAEHGARGWGDSLRWGGVR